MRDAPELVAVVADAPRAASLLKPLRLRILSEARHPASATAIAAALGRSRQSVNYHVRALARAGFLRRAGRVRRRGMVEQRYLVSARAFVLAPDLLGPLSPGTSRNADKLSAAYLMSLAGTMQQEVGQVWRDAQARGKRVPVLALESEIAFETVTQRAQFAEALTAALAKVIAQHSSPSTAMSGKAPGRRYRLALGCYPLPRATPGPPAGEAP
jgi:DNA-binding transcriptional ArsR family regulator